MCRSRSPPTPKGAAVEGGRKVPISPPSSMCWQDFSLVHLATGVSHRPSRAGRAPGCQRPLQGGAGSSLLQPASQFGSQPLGGELPSPLIRPCVRRSLCCSPQLWCLAPSTCNSGLGITTPPQPPPTALRDQLLTPGTTPSLPSLSNKNE